MPQRQGCERGHEGGSGGAVHGQREPAGSVQELQVPRSLGRADRRRDLQGVSAAPHDGGRPVPQRHRSLGDAAGARADAVRADHARARADPRHGLRALGQQDLGSRSRRVTARLPQGRRHRRAQRGRAGRAVVPRLPGVALVVHGVLGPRRRCQRSGHRDARPRARGLAARRGRQGAAGAVLRG